MAGLLLAVARVSLWLFPWTFTSLTVCRIRRAIVLRPAELRRLTQAVRAVARLIPGATCLTQALAAMVLASWHGHSLSLRIGVRKDAAGRMASHAWLEDAQGRVVLGETGGTAYKPIHTLGEVSV